MRFFAIAYNVFYDILKNEILYSILIVGDKYVS